MDKIGLFKSFTGLAVGSGISLIVTGIVKNNVQTDKNFEKVLIFVGRHGITMLLHDVTKKHIDEKIDSVIEQWKDAAKEVAP